MDMLIKTYRYRIRDSKSRHLIQMSKDVNFVFNFCNEVIRRRWKENRKYTNYIQLQQLTSGVSKELSINAQTIQAVCQELPLKVKQAKKQIRFRGKKSLGWIPFNGQTIRIKDNIVTYNGYKFRVWKDRDIEGKIKCGSITQDSRGRWYINFVVEYKPDHIPSNGAIGIDPGCITTATCSDGTKFSTRNYRKYQNQLAKAQRANKKKRIKTIYAKIVNKRNDDQNKFVNKLVKQNNLIFIGNVSPKKLSKTRLAKSVLDNSWGKLKSKLLHKTKEYGGKLVEVNEAYTSKTCSDCSIRWDIPKGLKGLVVREYKCPNCGVVQDRDINAARNILRFGHETLNRGNSDL